MGVTISIFILLALPVVLYVYDRKQNQAYLDELEILDEPYKRLLEAGVLSTPVSAPNFNRNEHRS